MSARAGADPRDTTSDVGRLVGDRYRIEALVGRGGMGEVFRARDERLGMTVALKSVSAGLAADPERRRLFEQEIAAQARATHPYVAQVLEVATDGERLFLVMEYIEGQSLAGMLRSRRPSVAEVRAWGRQLAQALQAIHERALLHRDVKPGNVMITPQGIAKLTDFGIASTHGGGTSLRIAAGPRAAAGPADASTPSGASPGAATHATEGMSEGPTLLLGSPPLRPGTPSPSIVGTPAYMSPEQQAGATLDGRTDLFSLGIVLWEAVTGRHPFWRERGTLVSQAIREEAPDGQNAPEWRRHPHFKRLVLRLLEKDPAQRFASAVELADAFAQLHEPWPRWARALAALGAVAGLAITSIAAGWPDRHPVWPPSHWFEKNWPRPDTAEQTALSQVAQLSEQQRARNAVELLEPLVRARPGALGARLALARNLYAAGFEARARDTADSALYALEAAGYSGNDLPSLDARRVAAYVRSRASDEVAALQKIAVHWSSARPDVLRELGDAYASAGRYAEAAAALRRHLETRPREAQARLSLARVLADTDAISEAERELATVNRAAGSAYVAAMAARTEAEIEYHRPDYSRAFDACRRAELLFAELGDTRQALFASMMAADSLVQRGDLAQHDFEEADRRFREIADHAESVGLYSTWVETLNARGALLRKQGSPEAAAVLRRAADEARKLENEGLRVQPLATLANLMLEGNRLDDAERCAREVAELAARLGDVENANNAEFVLAGVMVRRGRIHEGVDAFRRIVAASAPPAGRPVDLAYASASLLEIEHALDRPEDAIRDGNVAIDTYRKISDKMTLAFCLAFRARVLAELGRTDDAALDVAAFRELVPVDDAELGVYGRVTEAIVALARDDFGPARDGVRALLAAAPLPMADEEVAARLVLAEAHRRVGDVTAALEAARAATHVDRASSYWAARATLLVAETALAAGLVSEAVKHATDAAARCAGMDMKLAEARAYAVLARSGNGARWADAGRALDAYIAAIRDPDLARTCRRVALERFLNGLESARLPAS